MRPTREGHRLSAAAVFGAGQVGGAILRSLATYPDVTRLVVFDTDNEMLAVRACDAATIASLRGHALDVTPKVVDMRNRDQLADCLTNTPVDVIIHAASYHNPWALLTIADALWGDTPRPKTADPFGPARIGPWLPLHLVLLMNLVAAQREAASDTPIVNVAFPDVTNAVLDRLGLAPNCGGGNSDMLVPAVKVVAAEHLGVPADEVEVRMIAHYHLLSVFLFDLDRSELERYPYWIQIRLNGEDVTARVDTAAVVDAAGRLMPKRLEGYPRVAESVAKNALRLMRDDPTPTHVPGPAGLVGAYEARLRRTGAEVVWPDDLPREDAIALNEHALGGLGLEAIREDGSVEFSDQSYETMKHTLGYDCRVLQPAEVAERAAELVCHISRLAGDR